MNDFKWRHFRGEIILGCVRWYCKYGISYRDLEEMMLERGIEVDHSTIYRWVRRYAPELQKRLHYYYKPTPSYWKNSWHVDETYIKVKGKWSYLYRAVDKSGNTVDFYLSRKRNSKAAKRFLAKSLKNLSKRSYPIYINTDKAPAYGVAIAELKKEGKCPQNIEHRQVKYLNNIVEADHGKLKQLINPVRGFKTMQSATATIKGFEVMRMFRKGQLDRWKYGQGLKGEIRLINQQFGIYSC